MSNTLRNIQKQKSNRPRKGLSSTGEPKGPKMLGRASLPMPEGKTKVVYRAECKKCHGTGYVGQLDRGKEKVRFGCSCVPGSKYAKAQQAPSVG